MSAVVGELVANNGRVIAIIEIERTESGYQGRIQALLAPPGLIALFRSFEQAVTGQLLIEVDSLEDEIAQLGISFVQPEAEPMRTHDLQIYPELMTVSFAVLDD